MVTINKYIKTLLHPAGGHQGSHKAHQAGNHFVDSIHCLDETLLPSSATHCENRNRN